MKTQLSLMEEIKLVSWGQVAEILMLAWNVNLLVVSAKPSP